MPSGGVKGRSEFLQKLIQFGEDRGPLPKDAMPEGKQRSPEASKALAQLYNTTIQYFSSLEASEGFAPFSKAKSGPVRRKARNVPSQSTHISFIAPHPSAIQKAVLDKS